MPLVSFLSPDLKRAILDGEQPFGLMLQTVMTRDVPFDWDDQLGARSPPDAPWMIAVYAAVLELGHSSGLQILP